jgi:hypothetical protein
MSKFTDLKVNLLIHDFLKPSFYLGYGHISPRTVSGRIVTIVYAIIGIPIFLILLADFGKLFTRIIKFLWVSCCHKNIVLMV